MEPSKAKAIWDSIIQETKSDQLKDGEYTIKMFMELAGCGRDKAVSVLTKKVEDGILVTERRYIRRFRTVVEVYRPSDTA